MEYILYFKNIKYTPWFQPLQEGNTNTKMMFYDYAIYFIVKTTCVILL